jgi:hypothetical protein
MWDWLINITQPQATLGAAAVTFIGAIVAVLLGWVLFSAKVKDMRSAISATDELVKAHQASVVQSLADIEAKISGLSASAGQLRADLGDRQAAADDTEVAPQQPIPEPEIEVAGERSPELFPAVASAWHSIRDHLEEIAADPNIDGRTAAKYQRIDRRSYADLIQSLARDGRLQNPDAFQQAARLWSRYRTRRLAPNAEDSAQMVHLATTLAAI